MLSALLYLRLTSFQNWLRSRLRRLRQPKYLTSAIVGCAYFYFFFFRNVHRGPGRGLPDAATANARHAMDAAHAMLPSDWLPVALAFGALALLFFLTLMWVVPTQRAALGFTEAEIAFLFPAPMTRRALVHFRLLSAQFRSLLGAAVMMMISNRWSFLGGNAFTHAIGWWFIFSALNLHFSGASFTLTRLGDRGLHVWWRRAVLLLFVASVVGSTVLLLPAGGRFPEMSEGVDLRPVTDWLVALTAAPPLGWLLWPLKVVLAPFLALDVRHFAAALPAALAIITLHYLWVVNTAVAFEEASLEFAEKRSARIAAWRSGERRLSRAPRKGRTGPFRLLGSGRPELAFLWKNLLAAWPHFTVRAWLTTAGVIVVAGVWLHTQPALRGFLIGFGSVALFFALYVMILGPQFARQDIRSDLANADILKTYPLPGWQIVLGELLAPVAILTGLVWLAVLTVALTFYGPGQALAWLTPSVRITTALALALIAPALVTLQLLVPNAAALVFPAWFQMARTRGGGPEVVGQRMIFFFAQILTIVVALLPPVLIAAPVIIFGQDYIGAILAISLATLGVFIVLVAEAWCGVWWLGQRFDRLDLSSELRA